MLKLSEEQKAYLKSTRNIPSGVAATEKYVQVGKRGSADVVQNKTAYQKPRVANESILQPSKIESVQRKKFANYNMLRKFENTRSSSGIIVKQQKHGRFDSIDRSMQISGSILPEDVSKQVA